MENDEFLMDGDDGDFDDDDDMIDDDMLDDEQEDDSPVKADKLNQSIEDQRLGNSPDTRTRAKKLLRHAATISEPY